MPEWVAWCPQCGPLSMPRGTDADGCCPTCGATATGPGVDAALAMNAIYERMRDVLRGLEWTYRADENTYWHECPECCAVVTEGHRENCSLAALLRDIGAMEADSMSGGKHD